MSFIPGARRPSANNVFPKELEPEYLLELGLTPREGEVLRWMVEGKRDREIARILNLSPRTVEKHAYNLFKKLNVETRTAAVNHWWRLLGKHVEFGSGQSGNAEYWRAHEDSIPPRGQSVG